MNRNCTRKKLFYGLVFSLFALNILAQTPTQTIRGTVVDADNNQALSGAEISLLGTEPLLGAITNEKGEFRLETVPVGRYQLQVSYLGYETLVVSELLLESGKESVQQISLRETSSKLAEVVVRGEKNARKSNVQVSSIQTITVEETLRFPATFYDPARLVITFAGVANDNDQTNNLVIRGNSPNGMSWRLEGVDIVNPNHLTNAGTFDDRLTQNGGSVNILSAQMLGASTFMTGAWSSEYGNALSGIMDMGLREGNNEQQQTTGQIGLIGIDLSTEGPLSKENGSSYLLNYRYSTLGLLTALGVELGDEAFVFQDLAFKFNFPNKKGGRFSLFGLGGISENVFEAERDSSSWEFSKDRFDIRFENKMTALGASYSQTLGNNTVWKMVGIASALESTRTADRLDEQLNLSAYDRDEFVKRKLSFSSTINHKINNKNRLEGGIILTDLFDEINSSIKGGEEVAEGSGGGILLQPHLRWQYLASSNVVLNLGLHYLYYGFNDAQSLEPRASLRWALGANQHLSLAYGLHSQTQLPQVYFASIQQNRPNRDLGFTKAHHFVIGYERTLKQAGNFKAEVYYQRLFDVPIETGTVGSFSTLNILTGFAESSLVNEGTGQNIGLELSLQKYLTNSYYYLLNASFYDSKYTAADGVERDTRYNGNYIFNITAGKEWKKQKSDKEVIFGLNARITYLGGFRDTPIDLQGSIDQNKTVYQTNRAFSIKQKDYFKTDLRVYWKRNKQKYNNTLALDIQNLTNTENEAYSYFDTQQQQIVIKNQLGLIPILSYRIEF